ncbi:MAG: ABC transporter permease [Cytophagia bacterium]|nr:MAG: ABC transporter permease [Cytophagales bacterium]TAG38792.1 MAG: ABC transporter permease [Cytophagia bacterium]TAG51554.1 MAG: ABC transporter permease [Runella slithyformis]
MLRNYLKIALRNLVKNKVYSLVNIGGMAMGITAFILILEYVSLEKSVNQFHENLGQTFRLLNENPKGEMWKEHAPGWAVIAKKQIPEIKDFCRFDDGNGRGVVQFRDKNLSFKEDKVSYAEGNFFSFFSFPLVAGHASAFDKPDVTFISENHAKKYFGNENPLGKTLILNNQFGSHNYVVGGIFKDIQENSSIKYDMFFSLQTFNNPANLNGNDWASLNNTDSQFIDTYFSLNPNTDYKTAEKKLIALRKGLDKESDGAIFRLQPFSELHLADHISDKFPHTGDVKYVYMLLCVAFLILLIAWFNYINMSTANAMKRANEVGVRKVIGATQSHLIYQFLGESILVNILALSLSVVLMTVLQPFFNTLMGKNLSILSLANSSVWIVSIGVLILGSLLTGVYTAFVLSNFKPVETLKGKLSKTTGGVLLRKSLVVSQFGISVALVLATVLIYSQLQYMKNKDKGLNINQLLVISGPEIGVDSTFDGRKTAFWNELAKQSFVKDYAGSGSVPSKGYNFRTGGFTQPGSKPGDETKSYAFSIVGERYFDTYGIKLVAGRNFTKAECEVEWNNNNKVILNEQSVKELGFNSADEAVKTKIKWDERYLEVIGVIKDYNHLSLQNRIDPIIFYPQSYAGYITVRLTPENMPSKIAGIEKIYKKHFSENPFEYVFLDENFNKAYAVEQQYGALFSTASIWAIFIACLGLFGLATFTVESRTKEIGIRKVLGASVSSIIQMLSKDFIILIGIALLIASPVAYYFMEKWLANFPYRIDIEWWHFAISGVMALVFSMLSVGYQAIKAALMNPVKSLKTE